jgi:hypothetical protein
MVLGKKLIYAIWFARIALLFGVLGCLFSGYVSIFVDSDVMKSCALITGALMNSMLFFSTFPGHRIDVRFDQIKRKFFKTADYDNNSLAGTSMKNGYRQFITFTIALIMLVVFIIINFLLAIRAYSNNNHSAAFLHMVVIVAASFVFNALLLIYKVDVTFNKFEKLIKNNGVSP